MNDEVQQLLAHALRRSRHEGLRQQLARCTAPGAGLEELYAASALAIAPPGGAPDVALTTLLANAINLALSDGDRAVHVGQLVVRREAARVPVATRARPALLAFERARFDGSERETTVLLPKAGAPVDEPSNRAVEAFFKAKPDVPVRPEAAGRLVELAGDTSARPRRELHAEVVAACADNVAMLARHRDERPLWERGENEEALLANVDAVGASGGDCVRLLVEWWRAAEDPWKAWTATFALGCFEGTDVLEAMAGERARCASTRRRRSRDDRRRCVARRTPPARRRARARPPRVLQSDRSGNRYRGARTQEAPRPGAGPSSHARHESPGSGGGPACITRL